MKLQIKRSNVLDNGLAKAPTSGQMEFGELAINYNNTDVALFIKDDNGNIVKLYGDPKITLSETEPVNPVNGDLWWCSEATDGALYVYYTDVNSSQWVPATPIRDPDATFSDALSAIKTAAEDTTTDLAGFKAAIVTALGAY